VEEAIHAAEKHEACSEPLAALVAVARELIEQARAAEAERARVAAEAAAAEAAERLRLEQELAALTLRAQSDALRMQQDALRMQQVQAQLGEPPAAPAEETLCVVCFDAPKDHAFVPCGHQCVCGAADQDENPDVSRVPPRYPGDDEGVLLIAGLELDEYNLRQVVVLVWCRRLGGVDAVCVDAFPCRHVTRTPQSGAVPSPVGPAPSETAPQAAAPTVRRPWWEGNPNAE
jgi:hypothetical protein